MKRLVKYTNGEWDEEKCKLVIHSTNIITESHNQLFDVLRELLKGYKCGLVSIKKIN